jgi:DNA-binding transcriptional MocR family regulator
VVTRTFLGRVRLEAHPHALHVWLHLPARWPAERLVAEAAAQNLVVTPSSAFWTRTTPAPRAIRIALGGLDHVEDLGRVLGRLARILGTAPPPRILAS